MVRRAIAGQEVGLGSEQLFGYDHFFNALTAVDCNLRLPRSMGLFDWFIGILDRFFAPRTGIGFGDLASVVNHLRTLNRAKVVLATTDNTGLPAARLKAHGFLKPPLVYVSIGLPERLKAVAARSLARADRYRKRMAHVERFIAYGYAEAEWLRRWLGDNSKVCFIPFGVDTEKWHPIEPSAEGADLLSIGADSMRDFELLLDYARRRPEVNILLVTGEEWKAKLGTPPANVQLRVQVPIEDLRDVIAGARLVVLPVKENTYSGATTTLLQCMAMGKSVVVSRVGAIGQGYGLVDGVNVRWVEPGSAVSLVTTVDALLADETGRQRLGISARLHVMEKLSWDRYVTNMKNCLAGWLEQERAV